jgi:hypothetical protein
MRVAALLTTLLLAATAVAAPVDPLPPPQNPVAAIQPAPPPPPPAPKSRRKLAAIIAVAGGGVLLGTGIGFGLSASGRWSDAKDVCGGSTRCANDNDTEYANALADSARTRANVSTVLFVAGGLAAAAGVYLWVTAPSEHGVSLTATGSPNSAGLVVAGQF